MAYYTNTTFFISHNLASELEADAMRHWVEIAD